MEKGKNRLLRVLSSSNKMANEHERTLQDESLIKNNLTAVGRGLAKEIHDKKVSITCVRMNFSNLR